MALFYEKKKIVRIILALLNLVGVYFLWGIFMGTFKQDDVFISVTKITGNTVYDILDVD